MDNYYECGKGWEPLILQAEVIVNKYNQEHPNDEPIEFIQIKEKFGKLNLYVWPHIKEVDSKLKELENQSLNICENCGNKENVKRENIHDLIYTLCDKCKNKLNKDYDY